MHGEQEKKKASCNPGDRDAGNDRPVPLFRGKEQRQK